ncbi:MAG: class IV adenylate cyclase [Desulfatibacillum sp.]|nr:class IV adenylate cyclase [Desulfatibacillum sp.]
MEDLEIEVKFYCPDPEKTREIILGSGALSRGRAFEKNTLYDREDELFHRLSVLRLRQDKKITLTYKEPVPGSDPSFKIVKELEIEVNSFERSEQILQSLGFGPVRKYEKWRESFVLDQTKILLDTMPCGTFLELEGRRSPIRELAGKLEQDWDKRIILNYMQIFEIIRKGEGIESRDFTFQAFEGHTIQMDRYLDQFFAGKV